MQEETEDVAIAPKMFLHGSGRSGSPGETRETIGCIQAIMDREADNFTNAERHDAAILMRGMKDDASMEAESTEAPAGASPGSLGYIFFGSRFTTYVALTTENLTAYDAAVVMAGTMEYTTNTMSETIDAGNPWRNPETIRSRAPDHPSATAAMALVARILTFVNREVAAAADIKRCQFLRGKQPRRCRGLVYEVVLRRSCATTRPAILQCSTNTTSPSSPWCSQ